MSETCWQKILRKIEFESVFSTKSVWEMPPYHVTDLNAESRNEICDELAKLKNRADNPLGLVVAGNPGSGKTHLLASLRKEASERGILFIFVDMTGVKLFWDTMLEGYRYSLQQFNIQKERQHLTLLEGLINHLLPAKKGGKEHVANLSMADEAQLLIVINTIIAALRKKHPAEIQAYADTLRALVLLVSQNEDICSVAHSWLSGSPLDEEDWRHFGFTKSQEEAANIVKGISWATSLSGPTLLAIDQLDPIISQYHIATVAGTDENSSEEQRKANAIIQDLSAGLLALYDGLTKTLVVATCTIKSWEILEKSAPIAVIDRFRLPLLSLNKLSAEGARDLIAERLRPAYKAAGIKPPYDTYPFTPAYFAQAKDRYARDILKDCESYRRKCLKNKDISVLEVTSFPACVDFILRPQKEDPDEITAEFNRLKDDAPLAELRDENKEDEIFEKTLQTAGRCLLEENPLPAAIDGIVEYNFPSGKTFPPLHVRLRLRYPNNNDREEHYCLRGLLKTNPRAFQCRLKAAVTCAGIDHRLRFRHLAIFRDAEIPGGPKTAQMALEFEKAGGLFLKPTEKDLRTLWALSQLEKKKGPEFRDKFRDWLQAKRPATELTLLKPIAEWLQGAGHRDSKAAPTGPAEKSTPKINILPIAEPKSVPPALDRNTMLPIGKRYVAGHIGEPVDLPLSSMTKHTAILAASGSGKTELIKRLIEEAALLRVPSIAIDLGNDLCQLGDERTVMPVTWTDEDLRKKNEYFRRVEVVIWTPGASRGNPLVIQTLPDFSAVANDLDDLEIAVQMVLDTLMPIAAPGVAETAQKKQGLLAATLRYFGRKGGGILDDLVDLLRDLPDEAQGGIGSAASLGRKLADSLCAAMQKDPLMRSAGTPLDPAILFGTKSSSGKTRVSVINLSKLGSLSSQQSFLNRLFMSLFTSIKRNPAELTGLLAVDEAKDVAPSGSLTPCKENLLRLAAQGRKYGLGLIIATQAPKDVDHKVIANCTTQFYGRANSPASIQTIRDLLAKRGGSGEGIPQLQPGEFFLSSDSSAKPARILAPRCLSDHRAALSEEAILDRAAKSRMLRATE